MSKADYGLIDAHCHLFFNEPVSEYMFLDYYRKKGIYKFITSILYQSDINKSSNPYIKPLAGLHPYLFEKTDLTLLLIEELIKEKSIIGIGEIGLDLRFDNLDTQKEILLLQLELAKSYDLCIVFHCVKAYYELAKIIKYNFPKLRAILHGFKANLEIYDLFKPFDVFYSISKRLDIEKQDKSLFSTIIKNKRFVIESDFEINSSINSSIIIESYQPHADFFTKIIKESGLKKPEFIDIQYNNLKYCFPDL